MHPNALAVLAERGINADEFRTTALNEAVLEDVDTVVGASREHRAAAVTLRPALLKKSFTLAELSRTTGLFADDEMPRDGDLPARLEGLVSVAARRRGLSLPNDPADDDLADPLDQPVDAFEACARQIDAYLDPVVRALLG
jgi:protein-tyrosine phosphatase